MHLGARLHHWKIQYDVDIDVRVSWRLWDPLLALTLGGQWRALAAVISTQARKARVVPPILQSGLEPASAHVSFNQEEADDDAGITPSRLDAFSDALRIWYPKIVDDSESAPIECSHVYLGHGC